MKRKLSKKQKSALLEKLLANPNSWLHHNPIVRSLKLEGLPVTRANYLKLAGLPQNPHPELEAEIPDELRRGGPLDI